MISTPFRSLNSLSIFPTSAFSFPYISCLRYFGAKTIWYLLCDKLFTHPLTRTSRAAFSWLPDHFYSSPGGSSFLLSVFYPPPVQLGGSCLFGDKKGKKAGRGIPPLRPFLPANVMVKKKDRETISLISSLHRERRKDFCSFAHKGDELIDFR